MTQTNQVFLKYTKLQHIFLNTLICCNKKAFKVICYFNLKALGKKFSKVQDGYLAKET